MAVSQRDCGYKPDAATMQSNMLMDINRLRHQALCEYTATSKPLPYVGHIHEYHSVNGVFKAIFTKQENLARMLASDEHVRHLWNHHKERYAWNVDCGSSYHNSLLAFMRHNKLDKDWLQKCRSNDGKQKQQQQQPRNKHGNVQQQYQKQHGRSKALETNPRTHSGSAACESTRPRNKDTGSQRGDFYTPSGLIRYNDGPDRDRPRGDYYPPAKQTRIDHHSRRGSDLSIGRPSTLLRYEDDRGSKHPPLPPSTFEEVSTSRNKRKAEAEIVPTEHMKRVKLTQQGDSWCLRLGAEAFAQECREAIVGHGRIPTDWDLEAKLYGHYVAAHVKLGKLPPGELSQTKLGETGAPVRLPEAQTQMVDKATVDDFLAGILPSITG